MAVDAEWRKARSSLRARREVSRQPGRYTDPGRARISHMRKPIMVSLRSFKDARRSHGSTQHSLPDCKCPASAEGFMRTTHRGAQLREQHGVNSCTRLAIFGW